MSESVETWCRRAIALSKEVHKIRHALDKFEDSYAPMRDEHYHGHSKERIDAAFAKLMDARALICNPPMNGASEYISSNMSGGRRSTRRRSKK
jgi:hypothetical protein